MVTKLESGKRLAGELKNKVEKGLSFMKDGLKHLADKAKVAAYNIAKNLGEAGRKFLTYVKKLWDFLKQIRTNPKAIQCLNDIGKKALDSLLKNTFGDTITGLSDELFPHASKP